VVGRRDRPLPLRGRGVLCYAKAEDDLVRCDMLLDELRALAATYPDDAASRRRLAAALSNAFVYAEEEDDRDRCDALFDELRALALAYPDDDTVCERLDLLQRS